MSVNRQQVQLEEFRLVLILSWSEMVLVEQDGGIHRVPRMSIPKWTRPAEQFGKIIRERWGVRSFVIDILPGTHKLPRCAVIEVRTRGWRFALHGFVPVHVDDLHDQELTGIERFAICRIIAQDTRGRGPFSRLGWIDEAQEWIRESVPDRPVEFDEDIRQINAGASFALVRFGLLHGPAYWLKATSTPNAHEFMLTQTLAQHFPDFLPPLVAARSDWNSWVTQEVGQPLRCTLSLESFERSVRDLASLQIKSATNLTALFCSGCFDQRMPVLRTHVPALIGYLEDAMARQTSTKVAPLTARRLRELGRHLEEACASMEAIGIPESLIHNDMNVGNILLDDERAVFVDWSDAGIGNPFFTFHHLLAQAMNVDTTRICAQRLKQIYKERWRTVLFESQIDRASALCSPLAIASYLCGRDPQFVSPYRREERVQSYSRSLAREMAKFAQSSEFLEALCP